MITQVMLSFFKKRENGKEPPLKLKFNYTMLQEKQSMNR